MDSEAPKRRGALIVVEGLDRAGKSTQCDLLLKRLEQDAIPAKLQKFPDRTTPIGSMINSYLQNSSNLDDRAIHLLFSANRWEACESLKSTLLSGTTIVVDRYIYSGVVFSAAKPHPTGGGPPLTAKWCRDPDVGLPRPDVIIFLNISEEAAAKRAGFGDERYEKKELQDRVRRLFGEMQQDERDKEDWWTVDAAGTVEEVSGEVWKGVQEGLKRAAESNGHIRTIE